MAEKKEKKDQKLLIQRNYLMHVAKEMLHMGNAEIATVFNCTRQTVFSVLKKK